MLVISEKLFIVCTIYQDIMRFIDSMPKFSANLSMMFTEVEFLRRFKMAAEAGVNAVEYQFASDCTVDDISGELDKYGLELVLFNLPINGWDDGERGIACFPDRIQEFQQGVEQAVEDANTLGCKRLNCLSGVALDITDRRILRDTFVENLKFTASKLQDSDISLLIEPINTKDIPGFYLCNTLQARSVIEEVGYDKLNLQYDIYHMQVMEGDLARTIEDNLDIIGHIQIADNPGRHEPGTGEINYPFLFNLLDKLNYKGWVGCEYKPIYGTKEGLYWIREYL